MISTDKPRGILLCLILFLTAFAITPTSATTENNYNNDTNLLPGISESTHTENDYTANIIINPDVTGIYTNENGYKLYFTLNPNPIGGSLTENGYKLYLIPQKSFPEPHDISITNIEPSKNAVGQGLTVAINVILSNLEFNFETFYVTIEANEANMTAVITQVVTLTSRGAANVVFKWNTTDFAKGNYTISGHAWPIPGETATADNTLTDGWIIVTIQGDVDGDFDVDFDDFTVLPRAYGSISGQPAYNVLADIDGDGDVDLDDLIILAENYGKTDP